MLSCLDDKFDLILALVSIVNGRSKSWGTRVFSFSPKEASVTAQPLAKSWHDRSPVP